MRENLFLLILAGGLGTRLRPITLRKPKPLVKVLGHPLIYTLLLRVRDLGFRKIFINSHYLPEMLENEVRKIAGKLNLSLEILREKYLLDTGGTVKRVIQLLKERGFLRGHLMVHNADVLPLYPLNRFLQEHLRSEDRDISLLCVRPAPLSLNSQLKLNVKVLDGIVSEIPSENGTHHFCGVYLIDLEKVGKRLPKEEIFSALTLFQRNQIRCISYSGFFWDMGTFKGLLYFLGDLSLLMTLPYVESLKRVN